MNSFQYVIACIHALTSCILPLSTLLPVSIMVTKLGLSGSLGFLLDCESTVHYGSGKPCFETWLSIHDEPQCSVLVSVFQGTNDGGHAICGYLIWEWNCKYNGKIVRVFSTVLLKYYSGRGQVQCSTLGNKLPVLIKWEAGLASQLLWSCWWREQFLLVIELCLSRVVASHLTNS